MLHVVFGAGQVGAQLARSLAEPGHRVRVVRRSASPVGEGIEVVAGDARDAEFVRRVSKGAAVLYHCMNPSAYSGPAWEAEFPAFGEALIAGALSSGARLVCLDNLYPYGISSETRRESSPFSAEGPKGRVRIAWQARLDEAQRKDGLRYALGRGGDFFGPGAGNQSLFSSATVAGLRKGSSAWLVGDATVPHAFSYVPDVVAGLLALGEAAEDVEGRAWHLPMQVVAPGELILRMAAESGSKASYRSIPPWMVRALGVFGGILYELRETLYQWDRPFLASDAAFRARFPGVGVSLEEAVRGSVRTSPS